METAKGIVAFIVGIVIIAALTLGAWQLGWIFKKVNTDRQVSIDNRNLGTQTAWHDEIIASIADAEKLDKDNIAGRNALINQACNLIPRLTNNYRDDQIDQIEMEYC